MNWKIAAKKCEVRAMNFRVFRVIIGKPSKIEILNSLHVAHCVWQANAFKNLESRCSFQMFISEVLHSSFKKILTEFTHRKTLR